MPQFTEGPDAPVNSRATDHLERWSTAKEIYDIIKNSPSEWGVRVGIFGKWGSGKTSVLNFIENIAGKDAAIIVHFNPWGCTTERGLWLSLTGSVFNELSKRFPLAPQSKQVRAKLWLARGRNVAENVAIANDYVAAGCKALESIVSNKFDLSKKDFEPLAKAAEGKQIIILVDDLDRTSPELVPRLLFGLQSLLDIPGFKFILGFDPEVVGKALGSTHQGFNDGLRFLEKIIDFPIWLPEPTDHQLRTLLSAQIEKDCPWIQMSDIEPLFEKLPKNPRSLKKFIRHLWRLGPQVNRYERSELNFTLLILINLLKIEWPAAAHYIFTSKELIDELLIMSIDRQLSPDRQHLSNGNVKVLDLLKKQLKKAEIDAEPIINGIFEHLVDIFDTAKQLSREAVMAHARLTEDPEVFSWKEYDSLADTLKDADISKVQITLKEYSNLHQFTYEKTLLECYEGARNRYALLLDKAADVTTDESLNEVIETASQHLNLLKLLVLNTKLFSGENPILTIEHLKILCTDFSRWAHFTTPHYQKIRGMEREILLSLTDLVQNTEDYYNIVMPNSVRGFTINPEEAALFSEIKSQIEPKLVQKLLDLMRKEQGINNLLRLNSDHRALRQILISPSEALLGDSVRRKELLDLLKEAPINNFIAQNALDFFIILTSTFKSRYGLPQKEIEKLMTDYELILTVWEAATAQRLQPRLIGSMLEMRKGIIEQTKIPELPFPSWMTTADISTATDLESDPVENSSEEKMPLIIEE